jgi:predicted PurR-regulated permease PerM
MKRRLCVSIALVCALFGLAVGVPGPAPALASASAVLSDCQRNARLTQTYSVADLQKALATMPVFQKEYTDCYDVIQTALQNELKGITPSGSSTGSSGGSFLPTWLIVVLVVLVLAAATFGAVAVRRRRGPPPASP